MKIKNVGINDAQKAHFLCFFHILVLFPHFSMLLWLKSKILKFKTNQEIKSNIKTYIWRKKFTCLSPYYNNQLCAFRSCMFNTSSHWAENEDCHEYLHWEPGAGWRHHRSLLHTVPVPGCSAQQMGPASFHVQVMPLRAGKKGPLNY